MAKETDTISNAEKYRILIAARNFHYENFNKWLTYFYVAVAALFLGYVSLESSETADENIKLAVIFLGYLVSLFLYWSSKGYYYWNINFIKLVHHYEEKMGWEPKDRLYSVFADTKTQDKAWLPATGANISTSKVAILFAFIIACAWGLILIKSEFSYFPCNITEWHTGWQLLIAAVGSTALTLMARYFGLKSKINTFENLQLDQ